MSDVAVVGTGLVRFGKHLDASLKSLAGEAITAALADAHADIGDVEMAFVANSMAAVTTGQVCVVGQTVLRAAGFSGIPVFNIDNACASSSSALALGVQAIRSGSADTVLVVGVEKLFHTDRSRSYVALNGAADVDFVASAGIDAAAESVFVAAIYPERLARYRETYSLSAETLARIAVKNRAHAGLNPVAQYTAPLSVSDVLAARVVAHPLTALMCAPISDGASAVLLTKASLAHAAGRRPVWVKAGVVGMGAPPGHGSSVHRLAQRAYAAAGIGPADVDLAEVHDSIAFNELLAYEELGFCEPGKGAQLVAEEATSLGGRIPVNTSGGLESRGHPVAATGLAQIVELTDQLRGRAGQRQVDGAAVGVAENAGGFAAGDTAALAITVLGRERG